MLRFHLAALLLTLPGCVLAQPAKPAEVEITPQQSVQYPAQADQSRPDQLTQDRSKPASVPQPNSLEPLTSEQAGEQKQDVPAASDATQSSAPSQKASEADQKIADSERQPKRILGIMPNYRAVSAGAIPPPPSPKQAFVIATRNSFDYSAFVFVGLTSLIAEGSNAHPQLGKGVAGFGRYYWRGFLDKTDGNYLVIWALPSVLHEDERYYAMGHAGGFWKRFGYSMTRVAVARDYEGQNTPNVSELLGRGMAQAVSISYYPSRSRTAGAIATKYGYAILRDAVTNAFREFWPDIATHVLRRHP